MNWMVHGVAKSWTQLSDFHFHTTLPWTREWQPTSVFLPGESPEQRSLAGYSPWGCKELDVTETTEHAHIMIYNLSALLILCTQIHTHFPYVFYSIIANAELMNTELLLLGEIQG